MDNILKRSNSHIYRALLKNDYENWSITILEYCEPDKCIERENYYLSCLPHEYNILEKAGSTLGSPRNNTGEKNPMFGKNHSDESKRKISDAQPTSIKIEVTDITNNTTTTYDHIREATRALNFPNHCIISNYIKNNQKKPYKGKYTFKKV